MSKRPFTIGEELKKAGVPGMDTDREQIEYMDLDKILPDPENFYSLDGIEELAANIELIGLQQPLRVRDVGRGYVMVVSGHRRRAACLAIRDGGNPMFDKGVAIIRERGDVSKEWQELKLIYGNSATRILTGAEISKQSEKVVEILGKLEEQGVKFPGRTRDHVAAILQTSKSRVGRLHAIRANLVPELLQEFDAGHVGETVAYRLSQEEATVQHDLAAEAVALLLLEIDEGHDERAAVFEIAVGLAAGALVIGQMVVVERKHRHLGAEVRHAIGADGGDERQVVVDELLHVFGKCCHGNPFTGV